MPAQAPYAGRLSDEQIAILRLVAQGHTDERISRELGMSKSSVQRRLRTAALAMGAASRLTLVLCAIEHGVIQQPSGLCGRREANSSSKHGGTATEPANRTE